MRLFRIPSSVSKYLVFATMGSVVAATAYVTYERVVNRNPMRLRKDAEGVYHWMTYEEHLEDLLRVRRRRRDSLYLSSATSFLHAAPLTLLPPPPPPALPAAPAVLPGEACQGPVLQRVPVHGGGACHSALIAGRHERKLCSESRAHRPFVYHADLSFPTAHLPHPHTHACCAPQGYTVALEKERRKNAAARGGVDQRPLSDDDLKL